MEAAPRTPKMTIDKVVLNPRLEDRLFGKPGAPADAVGERARAAAAANTIAPAPAALE